MVSIRKFRIIILISNQSNTDVTIRFEISNIEYSHSTIRQYISTVLADKLFIPSVSIVQGHLELT